MRDGDQDVAGGRAGPLSGAEACKPNVNPVKQTHSVIRR